MKTYDIKSEFFDIYEMMENSVISDSETGEVTEDNTELLKEMLAELKNNRGEKLDNIEYIKRELKLSEEALKQESTRLRERAKMFENNIKKLADLQDFLLAGDKEKTDKFTYFYGKSESLEITDESKVPDTYISFEPKIDRTGLKSSVKGGLVIDGIIIKEKISLRVR